jgi:subtilisin family serine protease
LEIQLEQLKDLEKKFSDPGPIFDIVVFHDGQVWRVAIDTMETGDLTSVPLLTDYKTEFQFSTFSNQDLLNFSVNIYDNGNTVSIVTSAGTHGTHVAGIVGAFYKDQPELNGFALILVFFLVFEVLRLEFNLSVLKSEIHVWEPWKPAQDLYAALLLLYKVRWIWLICPMESLQATQKREDSRN